MELRDKIASIVAYDDKRRISPHCTADAILAIPEIAEARRLKASYHNKVGYERQG